MTEKFKIVWESIEGKIGSCCLHKKAAFNEISGRQVLNPSLVTSASPEIIEKMIGTRKCEKSNNKYHFVYDGVPVDITTVYGVETKEELCRKAFRHTLTIDSLGISRNGKLCNAYGGLSDIKNKTIRLTDANSKISELIYKRMLLLDIEGYRFDEAVLPKIEWTDENSSSGFKKRFCEVLVPAVYDESISWAKIAELLITVGKGLEKRKRLIEYTVKLNATKCHDNFADNYLFLIFAMLKLTSKDIGDAMKNCPQIMYYDSVCTNLFKEFKTKKEFDALKENYGTEFMDLLFDIQNMLCTVNGESYKRPTEKSFDLMAQFVADGKFWTDGETDQETISDDTAEDMQLEGKFDFQKAVSDGYNAENYDDTGSLAEIDDINDSEEPAEKEVIKKSVCIDDVFEGSTESGGFDAAGLSSYENAAYEKNNIQGKAKSTEIKAEESILSNSRGHISRIISMKE